MPIEAIFAAVAFVGLFTMWVVLPSKMKAGRGQQANGSLVAESE